ncbi:MAG: DUF932 domain-containing protein [Mycobacterium sp.]
MTPIRIVCANTQAAAIARAKASFAIRHRRRPAVRSTRHGSRAELALTWKRSRPKPPRSRLAAKFASSPAAHMNRPGMSGDSVAWERPRTLRALDGVRNRMLMSPSNSIWGKHDWSRSTPIFLWCCEPVWERGGGGRTVSRPLAGTVDCCFEHV